MLLNQTWVHSPVQSKAHQPTPVCGEGKCIYCTCRTRSVGNYCLKHPNSPVGFGEGSLQVRRGGHFRVCNQLVHDLPVVGEVTGWRHRGYHHQSQAPAVTFFHLVGVLASVKWLRNVHQTLLPLSSREELKILWLLYSWSIYCINYHCFLWSNCYFSFLLLLHVLISLVINSRVRFCDSGEAWKTKAFLQTRDRQRTWGALSWEDPTGSHWVTDVTFWSLFPGVL